MPLDAPMTTTTRSARPSCFMDPPPIDCGARADNRKLVGMRALGRRRPDTSCAHEDPPSELRDHVPARGAADGRADARAGPRTARVPLPVDRDRAGARAG